MNHHRKVDLVYDILGTNHQWEHLQPETELNFSTSSAPSTSMSLTRNFSEEDTGLGNQTKRLLLACRNHSLLLLLLKAEEVRRVGRGRRICVGSSQKRNPC
jgi:hypothetical protein